MKYVKLISKRDEWFDVGTEVFDGSVNTYGQPIKRISYEDYAKNWEKSGIILGFGLRKGNWDMEVCPLEEFEISYTEDQI
jgi:hypothetical protein